MSLPTDQSLAEGLRTTRESLRDQTAAMELLLSWGLGDRLTIQLGRELAALLAELRHNDYMQGARDAYAWARQSDTPEAATARGWALIQQLRAPDGARIAICSPNPDFGGPNEVVEYYKDYDDTAGTSYYGTTVLDCLEQAAAAQAAN